MSAWFTTSAVLSAFNIAYGISGLNTSSSALLTPATISIYDKMAQEPNVICRKIVITYMSLVIDVPQRKTDS